MTGRTIGALPNCLAGLALGGFNRIPSGVHPAMAFSGCRPGRGRAGWPHMGRRPGGRRSTRRQFKRRLAAQGYRLMAPLQRRPGIYLADVRAGPAGYQRLVIDARSGDILERFTPPPRSFGPEFAVGNGWIRQSRAAGAVQPTPGPGFSGAPSAKSAYSGPANVRIPSAVSPFGSQLAPSSMRPEIEVGSNRPPDSILQRARPRPPPPPLPPPAPPREAVKPDELPPPAAAPEPKIDSSPGDVEHASTTEPAESPPPQSAAPELKIVSPPSETEDASTASSLAPEPKPEAAKVEPQRETQTPPAGPPPAPASSAESSENRRSASSPPSCPNTKRAPPLERPVSRSICRDRLTQPVRWSS